MITETRKRTQRKSKHHFDDPVEIAEMNDWFALGVDR